MLSEISEALLAEPPPLPAAPPPPVATARPAAPRSWRRWGIAAALGLVLGLPFNLLLLSWLRPADLPVADASRDAEIRRYHAYLPLVRGAGELLAQGDIDAAIEAYRRAERIAPAPERVRRLREEAERLRVDQTEVARRTAEADLLVSRGEEVLARRRFDEAANIARQALALMPGHPPALDLLGRAEERNSQRPAVPAPRPSLPANQPVPAAPEPVLTQPAPQPLAPVPAPPAPAGDATLRIDFRTEQSSGVLTLYAGQQQLLREPFHFTEKAGFLRTRDVGGHFERTLKLKPGQINLRVYVALDKTRTESLDGNFLPGSSRTLEVRVGSAGELSVQLR